MTDGPDQIVLWLQALAGASDEQEIAAANAGVFSLFGHPQYIEFTLQICACRPPPLQLTFHCSFSAAWSTSAWPLFR
jgi:hypothetical protein